VDELKADVKTLNANVAVLADRYNRSRRFAIALALVVVGELVLGLLYYLSVQDRRRGIQQQIGDLACFAVAYTPPENRNSQFIKALAVQYDCAHHHLSVPAAYPTPTITVSTTTTAHSTTTAHATTTTTATSTTTTTKTTQVPGALRYVTVTRTPGPQPTRTVTRTTTHTATVTKTCFPLLCRP
jgi:hypothetical protein